MAKVNKKYGECSICMDDILDSNDKVTTKCHHTFQKIVWISGVKV